MLQPAQKSFHLFTCEEVQAIIQDHFGRVDYHLILAEEWFEGCDYQFQGVKKGGNTLHDRKEVEEFQNEGAPPAFMVLLSALVDDDVLPEGNYLISA